MGKEEPKKGTRINTRSGANANPVRGVTDKEAKRHLKANASGREVDPKKLKQSKKAASDHYATEAHKAGNSRSWWGGKKNS